MFWIILQFLIYGLLLTILVTQILIPVYRERPLFPVFRKRLVLESAIAEVNEHIQEDLMGEKLRERIRTREESPTRKKKTNKAK